jgi:hypothetical protein
MRKMTVRVAIPVEGGTPAVADDPAQGRTFRPAAGIEGAVEVASDMVAEGARAP